MPDWAQIIIRSFIFVIVLFLLVRGLGKKRLNQLSIFDYISAFVLSSLVAIVILDPDIPFFAGIAAIFVWFIIPFLADLLSLKSKTARDTLKGRSTVVIKEGKVLEDNLKKNRLATDDLLYHLRQHNIFRVADVEFALLEPTGEFSVMPKSEQQPITKKDLHKDMPQQSEIHTVIMDGEIMIEPLGELGRNPGWLTSELEKMNVTIENVFLGQLDDDAQLTIDLYDDNITVPTPTEKPLLLATLKKAEADLELFALATENTNSKQLYERNAQKLNQVKELLQPYME